MFCATLVNSNVAKLVLARGYFHFNGLAFMLHASREVAIAEAVKLQPEAEDGFTAHPPVRAKQ